MSEPTGDESAVVEFRAKYKEAVLRYVEACDRQSRAASDVMRAVNDVSQLEQKLVADLTGVERSYGASAEGVPRIVLNMGTYSRIRDELSLRPDIRAAQEKIAREKEATGIALAGKVVSGNGGYGWEMKITFEDGREMTFESERVALTAWEAAMWMLDSDSRITRMLKEIVPESERAKLRPSNFFTELSGEEQWAIDKSLGILDWDGGKT